MPPRPKTFEERERELAPDPNNLNVPRIDWNDPISFYRQTGFPMRPSDIDPAEVRAEARFRSARILNDYALLKQILTRFEATVQKRWLKRTREQRKKLLLAAWPDMPQSHRPDFEAFTKGPPGNPLYTDAFMWPHINLEDLLKPKLLLIFLNARGRHPPHAFINSDRDSTLFGRVTGNLQPSYLNEHVMMFTGRTTRETYGELISWKDDKRALNWMVTSRGMFSGLGLMCLAIQDRLYRFLVDCCMSMLLCDHPVETIERGLMPIQPEPPVPSTSDTDFNMLSVVTAEAPYRVPARLNLDRLRGIVAAKRSAAEDHIWSLREDPAYFANALLDRRQHRPEVLPDTHGKQHPSAIPHSQAAKALWNRVIHTTISDSYVALGLWDEMHLQLTNIQSLITKYGPDFPPEKDLPVDLEFAFLKFIWFLEHFVRGPIVNLQTGLPPSPPVRRFFVRAKPQYGADNLRAMSRDSWVEDKKRERFSFLLVTLWDEGNRQLFGLHGLIDEMVRMIDTEKSIKELVSPWVMSTISDLSMMSECLHEIGHFHPWAATFEKKIAEKEKETKADYMKNVDRWTDFDKEMDHVFLADIGDPTDGRFSYPVDKPRTRDNTVAMQKAEANLDAFWKKTDSLLVNKESVSQHAAIRHLLAEDRILRRTPDWVEPVKNAAPATVDDLCLPLSQLYFDLEQRTQRTVQPDEKEAATKMKVKTRGTTNMAPELLVDQDGQHGPDIQPTFTIDQRALKVFSTLFYTPSRTSQAGEVSWTDFLHAMRSTGFAIEKLYGSVWQFTPQKLDVERSIQFHEPHPSGKIPFRVARRHGRRLFRAYGWHAGMFELVSQ